MKISGRLLHALAIGLAYLCAMQMHTTHGMSYMPHAISDKTFAAYYIGKNLLKNWVSRPIYTYEKPFAIPTNIPSPDQLAQTIAETIGAENFLCGASTSAHQCGKLCTPELCSWSRFAQQNNLPQPTDQQYPMDINEHYKAYIDYAKNTLKLNSLRFSIEWALVQPDENSFDKIMIKHYAKMIAYAIKQGITPLICFHHYTDPCWFLDKGGFEREGNIDYFVQYCTTVYTGIMQQLIKKQKTVAALQIIKPLWATYNAPGGYAFRGYRQKAGPPCEPSRSGLGIVATVLKNMLEAHVRMYDSVKQAHINLSCHDIDAPKIGLLKNIHQIDPANETWIQYLASPITRFLISFADMIQNGSVYNFFTTGTFQVHIPFIANIRHTNKKAMQSLDFIGLNYYANRHMLFTKAIKPTDPNLISDNDWYYRYPQGMYRAIIELSENIARPLNIPLIVAENGIATTDDTKRAQFYHEYLYAIARAVQDGYKVYGYLPWTLADNYEWPELQNNKSRRYGLCRVTSPAKLETKDGAKPYLAFANAMHTLQKTT